jgi:hypothetical protein
MVINVVSHQRFIGCMFEGSRQAQLGMAGVFPASQARSISGLLTGFIINHYARLTCLAQIHNRMQKGFNSHSLAHNFNRS